MANNNNKILIGVFMVTAFVLAAYFYFENLKKDEKISKLEEDKLKLILDSLKHNPNLSNEIKQQLEKLIEKFKDVDEKVSNELAQALQLFQIGQIENAIEDLVKIIEHLLTVHYLLTFCKEEKKIDEVEFHFYIALKVIRNKEDHTLDLKLDHYLNASGLITAIGGIFKIASIVYPKKELNDSSHQINAT